MPGLISAFPVTSALRVVRCLLTTVALSCTLLSCQTVQKNDPQTAEPTAASGGSPTSPPTDARFIYKMAQIESATASLDPGNARSAKLTISGLLHDGATSVHEVKQQRTPHGVAVTVITARPRDALATLAIIPFERTVTVDLAGLPAGPCVITVNGVQTTLPLP